MYQQGHCSYIKPVYFFIKENILITLIYKINLTSLSLKPTAGWYGWNRDHNINLDIQKLADTDVYRIVTVCKSLNLIKWTYEQ